MMDRKEYMRCLGRTGERSLLVGILMGCTKDLNEFREADLILVNVVREVHVLEEHISDTVEALVILQ